MCDRYHPVTAIVQGINKAYLASSAEAKAQVKFALDMTEHDLGDDVGAIHVEHCGDWSTVSVAAWCDDTGEWERIALVPMDAQALEVLGKACLLAAESARMTEANNRSHAPPSAGPVSGEGTT